MLPSGSLGLELTVHFVSDIMLACIYPELVAILNLCVRPLLEGHWCEVEAFGLFVKIPEYSIVKSLLYIKFPRLKSTITLIP